MKKWSFREQIYSFRVSGLVSSGAGSRPQCSVSWIPFPSRLFYFVLFLKMLFIFIFREREGKEGRKRRRETTMCENINCFAYHRPTHGHLAHHPGMCLMGMWTSGLLVHRLGLNPLSHSGGARYFYFREFTNILCPKSWLKLLSTILNFGKNVGEIQISFIPEKPLQIGKTPPSGPAVATRTLRKAQRP